MASRRGGKMPQKKKRSVFGGQDSDAVIKFDSRNPVTARKEEAAKKATCLLYTSPSPRDGLLSRMPSSA